MSASYSVSVQPSLREVIAQIGGTPKQIDQATRKTHSLIRTWMLRRILQECSRATGIPQKYWQSVSANEKTSGSGKRGLRLYATGLGPRGEGGVKFWIGTKPIKVHRLGTVKWTRRMVGARVGRKSYPGTWSWSSPRDTAPAVMHRIGTFGRKGKPNLEKIDVQVEEIHLPIQAAIQSLMPEVEQRFVTLMRQQLNYYVNVRPRATS